MSILFEVLSYIGGSNETSLLALCFTFAVIWQVSGFAVSKQWYLIPLVVGLSAIAAFLLNPIADANSMLDLRAMITPSSTLLTLALSVVLAGALSVFIGIEVARKNTSDGWRLALAVLHTLPTIPLLLAVLFLQQVWLAQQVGARPEWVGLASAGIVAFLLLAGILSMLLLLQVMRTQLHLISCLSMIAGASLTPSLSQAMPSNVHGPTTLAAVSSLIPFLVLAATCMAVGLVIERRCKRPQAAQTAPNLSTR